MLVCLCLPLANDENVSHLVGAEEFPLRRPLCAANVLALASEWAGTKPSFSGSRP